MAFWETIMGIGGSDALEACELRIKKGLAAYRDAGAALKIIREQKLYRKVADTFETYCRSRWQMEPQTALRLIAASEVAQVLEPTGSVPRTERTARELAQLAPDDQIKAWAEAKTAAEPGEPTSKHVSEVVAKFRKPSGKTKRLKPTRLKVPGAIVIVEPGRGFVSVESALVEALAKIGVSLERAA